MKSNIKVILCFVLFLVLFVIIVNKNSVNLKIYKNTKISEKSKIESIIKKLDLSEDFKNFKIDGNKLFVSYESESYDYKTLEKNASYMFYLINDLSDIEFNIIDDNYIFSNEYIGKIYSDLNIDSIKKRYENKYFSYLYLGNINGNIDIFDKSDLCLENYEKLYEDDDYSYYITCSTVDDVVIVINDKEYKLKDSISDKINVNDLFNTNLKIEKREKYESNS